MGSQIASHLAEQPGSVCVCVEQIFAERFSVIIVLAWQALMGP